MWSTLLFLLLFSFTPSPTTLTQLLRRLVLGGRLSLCFHQLFFFFFFSSTCLSSSLWCYLLKPKSGIQGATVINGRSPAGEFHSLRRQSFQASLPWDFPHGGVLFLTLPQGGGGAGRAAVCPQLLLGLGCLQREGSAAETLKGEH